MEEKLHRSLGLASESEVNAGAGSGVVGDYQAKKGLIIKGVDLTTMHVEGAQRVTAKQGLTKEQMTVRQGDYHDLSDVRSGSLDGIYTIETFVHADDPAKVLDNFKRLLRPGGVLVLFEADFQWDSEVWQEVLRPSHCDNTSKEGAY